MATRRRIHRTRRHGHRVVEAAPQAREVRVARAGAEQVIVQVHVHADAKPAEPAPAPHPRRRTLRPIFTGRLFGWEDHYEPIAKKMQPILEGRAKKKAAGLLGRLRRFGLLIALLAAIAAVGCHYL
jgi:hypothetical protein